MPSLEMIPLVLQSFASQVASREGELFRQAILFGSHARGDGREDSDVDVAVILSRLPASLLDTKLELADIAYDVLLETGVLIQPMPLSEDEWNHPEHHLNPRLVDNIRREGRIL